MIKFHARTDVGRKRRNNEDSLLAAAEVGLFVVADGVGGRKAGELASAITVNTFQKYGPRLQEVVKAFEKDPNRTTRNGVLWLLDEAANMASKRVYEAAAPTGRQGMTTTLVAMVVGGGGAFIVHVGDSRAYLQRDRELRQLTEDHSMVNQLLRQGSITQEEAVRSRYRNVITRAIGLYPSVQADTLFIELVEGDRLMLCSDGCSDLISPTAISAIMNEGSVTQSCDTLIQASLDAGGKDNVTVIVVEPEAVLEAKSVASRAQAMERLFLFQDLPFHARLRVSRIVSEVRAEDGQVLVHQGDAGDTMYTVVHGEVAVVVDGTEVTRLGSGQHFGELTLADQLPRSADIIARGPCRLLCIERSALHDFCMLEPVLGNQIMWKLVVTLGTRLRQTNKMLGNTPGDITD
ncbi:MAG: serine/threonine protein phosphatase PrpC [Kiritimatiellia bacterium]|jgi:serine/threonine protein phosphatase PrpC